MLVGEFRSIENLGLPSKGIPVKVVDQYGHPLSGATVIFYDADNDGVTVGQTQTIGSDGSLYIEPDNPVQRVVIQVQIPGVDIPSQVVDVSSEPVPETVFTVNIPATPSAAPAPVAVAAPKPTGSKSPKSSGGSFLKTLNTAFSTPPKSGAKAPAGALPRVAPTSGSNAMLYVGVGVGVLGLGVLLIMIATRKRPAPVAPAAAMGTLRRMKELC
jgi:hypothetical protein